MTHVLGSKGIVPESRMYLGAAAAEEEGEVGGVVVVVGWVPVVAGTAEEEATAVAVAGWYAAHVITPQAHKSTAAS